MSEERNDQQYNQPDNNGYNSREQGSPQNSAPNPNDYRQVPPRQSGYQPPFYSNPYGQYSNPYGNPPPPGNVNMNGATGGNTEEYRWSFEDYEAAGIKKKPKRSRGLIVFTALLAVVMAVGVMSLSGYGVYTLVKNAGNNEAKTPSTSQSGNSTASGATSLTINDKPSDLSGATLTSVENGLSTVDIARKVKPSVVGITQYSVYDTLNPSGEGSGIIISADGYIVTNAHVVENAIGINVELYNGETYTARTVGIDKRTDLAVLKIEAQNLTSAEFGNSSDLEVGERVIAIGNPAGRILAGSVTQGIVSGVNRMVKDEGYSINYIQVDAAINPGNSGGALVNSFGQVVGINSLKITSVDYEGIGFAIPISDAKPIIDDLIANGYVTGRTKIGMTGHVITELFSQINNVPTGIMIYTVEPNSDLATKNVARGDIITHIDGDRVETFDHISSHLVGKSPGDTITLTIYRASQGGGHKNDVTIKVMADVDTASATRK